jgi:hypothetical protein
MLSVISDAAAEESMVLFAGFPHFFLFRPHGNTRIHPSYAIYPNTVVTALGCDSSNNMKRQTIDSRQRLILSQAMTDRELLLQKNQKDLIARR